MLDKMHDSDWINAATNVQGLVMTLWTVYVAIVAAALAFVTSGRPMLQKPRMRLLIIGAYLIASWVNLWAMWNLRRQHDIMVSFISDPALNILKQDMLRPSTWVYIACHAGVDIGMAFITWFFPQSTD
jgi:hypothetical protein